MKKVSKSESPIIGITPDVTYQKGTSDPTASTFFLSERISRAVLNAGGIPIVLPVISPQRILQEALDHLDGILVTGGNFDIHPRYYGEKPFKSLGEIKESRTQFELELITLSLDRDLPVLGICGGEQAINVAMGGSLYQDLATQAPHAIEHQQKMPKEHTGHPIRIFPATKLHQIVEHDVLNVNTTHHQAVKQPGRGLVANATSEDGIIEGIEGRDHSFVLGVQWHPEFLIQRDSSQGKIFSSLISACKEA